jgi:hypothetical protein
MPKLNYHEIKAVHEKSLRELIESLGLSKEIEEGKIRCCYCGKKITFENLQCIYPKGNEIFICCDDLKCFEKALVESGEERRND